MKVVDQSREKYAWLLVLISQCSTLAAEGCLFKFTCYVGLHVLKSTIGVEKTFICVSFCEFGTYML